MKEVSMDGERERERIPGVVCIHIGMDSPLCCYSAAILVLWGVRL